MQEPRAPGRMRQVILPAPGAALAIQTVPTPEPSQGEVLLQVTVATVCALTDLGIVDGLHPPHDAAVAGMLPHDLRIYLRRDQPEERRHYPLTVLDHPPFPAPMGHEAAGVVAALGPGANDPQALVVPGRPLAVGDRVTTFKVLGAYGEYSAISSSNVVHLPEFLSDEEGSLFEPLVINYNCLRRCRSIRPFSTVAVLGQGCQGLLATQVVRALGADFVIVSEPSAPKRRLAMELGADVALDPTEVSVVHEVERLTRSRGVDLVVECVGIEETIRAVPYLVRRGGLVAQVGAVTSPVTFDYGYVHFKHFIVVPSDYIRTLREVDTQVAELLGFLESGAVRLGCLITHRFDLADIADAFELLRGRDESVIKIAIQVTP